MKNRILILVLILMIIITSFTFVSCDKHDATNEPAIIFFDDFNELDTSKWNIYTKTTATDPGFGYDAILQSGVRKGGYWDKEQVFTKDGNLVIRTSIIDGNYYTGAIDTDNKWEKHYGYYEARVFLPKASGMWAAFWIFCDQMGGASKDADVVGTEIDIFESPYYGLDLYDNYQSAIHIGDYGSNYYTESSIANVVQYMLGLETITIYDTWHTFALDWTENGYDFYLDGKLMWSPDINNTDNISKKDSFLFLSCEIDGQNGVASKSIFATGTDSITSNPSGTFPTSNSKEGNYNSDFLVDYVKVWEYNPYK